MVPTGLSFVTVMSVYIYPIIISIGTYMLHSRQFKKDRKRCIVFSLGMGMGMYFLQNIEFEILEIIVPILVPERVGDAVIGIIASNCWLIGATMIYYLGISFVGVYIFGGLMKKIVKKEDLSLHTLGVLSIAFVWTILENVMITIIYCMI